MDQQAGAAGVDAVEDVFDHPQLTFSPYYGGRDDHLATFSCPGPCVNASYLGRGEDGMGPPCGAQRPWQATATRVSTSKISAPACLALIVISRSPMIFAAPPVSISAAS